MPNSNSGSRTKKEAKEALDRFKMEVASEIGVNLKEGTTVTLPQQKLVQLAVIWLRK